jgi:hypothetical protein
MPDKVLQEFKAKARAERRMRREHGIATLTPGWDHFGRVNNMPLVDVRRLVTGSDATRKALLKFMGVAPRLRAPALVQVERDSWSAELVRQCNTKYYAGWRYRRTKIALPDWALLAHQKFINPLAVIVHVRYLAAHGKLMYPGYTHHHKKRVTFAGGNHRAIAVTLLYGEDAEMEIFEAHHPQRPQPEGATFDLQHSSATPRRKVRTIL